MEGRKERRDGGGRKRGSEGGREKEGKGRKAKEGRKIPEVTEASFSSSQRLFSFPSNH